MSAYKKLNQQDAYISTYTARKSWIVSGSQYSGLGINNIVGLSGSLPYYHSHYDLRTAGNPQNRTSRAFNSRLIYESVKHLYYSLFQDTANIATGSYDNFLQSSYDVSGSRFLNNRFALFSLPKEMYGTHIEPFSISIRPDISDGDNIDGEGDNYVTNNYATDPLTDPNGTSFSTQDNQYIQNTSNIFQDTGIECIIPNLIPDYLEQESQYVDESPSAGNQYIDLVQATSDFDCNEIVDDGEGRLYLKNSFPRYYVGNAIYTHGQLIITDTIIAKYYNDTFDAVLKWKSNLPIFTHNYHCKVKSGEFNYTLNKTSLAKLADGTFNQDGLVETHLTGSDYPPYFTTVGLYNDSNELIAVGKMASPTPKSLDTDMSIIVQLDMNFGSNRGYFGVGTSPETTPEPDVLICTQYYVFRNDIYESGDGIKRNGERHGRRTYYDHGDYVLYRRRLPYTQSGINIPKNSTSWTTDFKYIDQVYNFSNRKVCYVDVEVRKYQRASGTTYYEYDFGGYVPGPSAANPSNSNPSVIYTYDTMGTKRSHQFFKDILGAYLLLEDEASLRDFGCEYPQPRPISGEA